MPVEVTPQTKNGTASSQKSRTRTTARIGTGAFRAACGSASMRRNSSTPTNATPTQAARKTSAASSEMSRKAREIGSITTEPAAVAAPTRPNRAPWRSRNSCVDQHRQRRVGRQPAAEAGDDADTEDGDRQRRCEGAEQVAADAECEPDGEHLPRGDPLEQLAADHLRDPDREEARGRDQRDRAARLVVRALPRQHEVGERPASAVVREPGEQHGEQRQGHVPVRAGRPSSSAPTRSGERRRSRRPSPQRWPTERLRRPKRVPESRRE